MTDKTTNPENSKRLADAEFVKQQFGQWCEFITEKKTFWFWGVPQTRGALYNVLTSNDPVPVCVWARLYMHKAGVWFRAFERDPFNFLPLESPWIFKDNGQWQCRHATPNGETRWERLASAANGLANFTGKRTDVGAAMQEVEAQMRDYYRLPSRGQLPFTILQDYYTEQPAKFDIRGRALANVDDVLKKLRESSAWPDLMRRAVDSGMNFASPPADIASRLVMQKYDYGEPSTSYTAIPFYDDDPSEARARLGLQSEQIINRDVTVEDEKYKQAQTRDRIIALTQSGVIDRSAALSLLQIVESEVDANAPAQQPTTSVLDPRMVENGSELARINAKPGDTVFVREVDCLMLCVAVVGSQAEWLPVRKPDGDSVRAKDLSIEKPEKQERHIIFDGDMV